MSKRLILIPRVSGTPQSDWYPWLQRQLQTSAPDLFEPVLALAMPHPHQPIIEEWVAKVAEVVGSDPKEIARTILVGHSIGCLAALHYLETLPSGVSASGALCVAGWWWVDHPWDALRPWMDTPVDLTRVRAAMGKCVVLISDNDPFVAGTAANRQAWEEKLKATVFVIPGAQHFNAAQQPAVLRTLIELCNVVPGVSGPRSSRASTR
jgi:predicted alpha/beta hydrolase family esterase